MSSDYQEYPDVVQEVRGALVSLMCGDKPNVKHVKIFVCSFLLLCIV
jgi:hypothetical protein